MDGLPTSTKSQADESGYSNATNLRESNVVGSTRSCSIEADSTARSDYDLNVPISTDQGGLRSNLPGYGDAHFSLFLRKVFIKALGYTDKSLSKPIISIINTFSSFNPCHTQVPQLVKATKRGILLASSLPMEFPTINIHESFSSPISMYLRNLMSIDTEEMVMAQPMDAVVMIGGCDKTVPAHGRYLCKQAILTPDNWSHDARVGEGDSHQSLYRLQE